MSCLKKYFNQIKTDFFVFQGADDYYLPNALQKSINFLKKNKSYVACGGGAILLDPIKNCISRYHLAESHNDSFVSRMDEYLAFTRQLQFSVLRTSAIKKIIKFIPLNKKLIPDKGFHSERLFNYFVILLGKCNTLSIPYLIRLVGDYNDGKNLLVQVIVSS